MTLEQSKKRGAAWHAAVALGVAAAAALVAFLLVRGLIPSLLLPLEEGPASASPTRVPVAVGGRPPSATADEDEPPVATEDGAEGGPEGIARAGRTGRRRRAGRGREEASGSGVSDDPPALDLGGVVAAGRGAYRVPRALVEEAIERGARPGGVRAIPRRVDGEIDGYRLQGGAASLPVLGLRPGDVLTSVNGMDLDSPDAALAIFGALRRARRVSLRLERDGRPMTLRYAIE